MEFNVNSPILFAIFGVIIAVVLAQSIFFLVRALKRSKEKGMDSKKIKKAIISSVVFTIAPAISILVGVVVLSRSLGVAMPWLRLSVVGSLSYETIAAQNTLIAMGASFVDTVTSKQFVTVFFVMTISIMVGIWLVPLVCKKVQKGMVSMGQKDEKWRDLFSNSMFIGMISAFLGFVFCDFSSVFKGETYGLVPVLVFLTSAVVMVIFGILVKKFKIAWLSDYALPVSMIVGMAVAIPLTKWLGNPPAEETVKAFVDCLLMGV